MQGKPKIIIKKKKKEKLLVSYVSSSVHKPSPLLIGFTSNQIHFAEKNKYFSINILTIFQLKAIRVLYQH